ncbi:MAG: HEAT repeat domain-containing protein, partial [Planctomycetes bacterium]|nr:HEAT repeat domain-containing protein [Planctomycetota bacterium]
RLAPRPTIARALWKLREPPRRLLAVLIVELKDERPDDQPWEAAALLGEFGPGAATAVPALTKSLKSPDAETRRNTAAALGKIGPAAKPALPALKALAQDPEEEVRAAAAKAIRRLAASNDHTSA